MSRLMALEGYNVSSKSPLRAPRPATTRVLLGGTKERSVFSDGFPKEPLFPDEKTS